MVATCSRAGFANGAGDDFGGSGRTDSIRDRGFAGEGHCLGWGVGERRSCGPWRNQGGEVLAECGNGAADFWGGEIFCEFLVLTSGWQNFMGLATLRCALSVQSRSI